jgi:integrase/recombinase XerC
VIPQNSIKTVSEAIQSYLATVSYARSAKTASTYRTSMNFFVQVLEAHNILPEKDSLSLLNEDAIGWLAASLKVYAPATEKLYLTAAAGLYEYLAAENLLPINLPRVHLLIRQRSRRPGQRLPQFPEESIELIVNHMINMKIEVSKDEPHRLCDLRDRAFLITLADTGLRVHEACNLRRGDLDWNEGRAIIIGKGDRQDIVRFSRRSIDALRDYLTARAKLDGTSNRPLPSLPIFARHDKGTGKKVKPITTTTGRNIVTERVESILGKEAVGTITPHSFRHYFVTKVLKASGNLKLAQELARHRNITVTQRYAHLNDDELDRGYWDVFEEDKRN